MRIQYVGVQAGQVFSQELKEVDAIILVCVFRKANSEASYRPFKLQHKNLQNLQFFLISQSLLIVFKAARHEFEAKPTLVVPSPLRFELTGRSRVDLRPYSHNFATDGIDRFGLSVQRVPPRATARQVRATHPSRARGKMA